MPIPDFSTLSQRLNQMDNAAFLPRNNSELKHSLTDLNHFLAQQLGKIGFKRPGDLKLFLASPAGEGVKTAIAERIAQKINEENFQSMFLQQERLRQLNLLLYLFNISSKKDAKSKQTQQRIQEEIEKQFLKKNLEAHQNAAVTEIRKELKFYNDAIETFDILITQHKTELAHVEREIRIVEREAQNIEARYAILEEHVAELEPFLAQPIEAIHREAIESRIQHITRQAQEANAHQREGINMQLKALATILDRKDNAIMTYDAQGLPTNSFKDTVFVLKPHQKIVLDNGETFIIHATEQFHLFNAEQRAQSRCAFQQQQPDITFITFLLKANYQAEKEANSEHLHSLLQKKDDLSQKIDYLVDKRSHAIEAKKELETLLKNSKTDSHQHTLAFKKNLESLKDTTSSPNAPLQPDSTETDYSTKNRF